MLALMASPRLLLLGEAPMGLSPILAETIFATIRNIRHGTTILSWSKLRIPKLGYVLQAGSIVLDATPDASCGATWCARPTWARSLRSLECGGADLYCGSLSCPRGSIVPRYEGWHSPLIIVMMPTGR